MDTVTVAEVSRRAGLLTRQGQRFVNAIVAELALGRRVRLNGLGEFRIATLPARTVRTPIVPGGVTVQPERHTIRFRRFPSAYRRVNRDI